MTLEPARALQIETEAAKRLLANLREQGHGDDAELMADAVEGETSLHEAVEAVLAQIDECDVMVVGLKAKEAAFAARRAKIEARAEFLQASIEQAMLAAEQQKITLPGATVFLSKRPAKLIVEDEASIPSRFFVEQERPAPKLDKKALADALKANETIPGATLDNGSVSLTIRRS
jgi:hypothetical protein